MTREDAIDILKDIQNNLEENDFIDRCALDMAIEALKNIQVLDKIPKYYIYDAETEKFLVYRHKYTGKEIHILKPTDLFVLERPHGEWIKGEPWSTGVGMGEQYGYYYTCSKCGHKVKGGYKSCGIKFCQECGADMRGDEKMKNYLLF